MKRAEFIEMTGKTLMKIITEKDTTPRDLAAVGVTEDSIVRVNRQGDVEVRRKHGWDIIGGLLGDFEKRVKEATGLDWA